jgi:hypothetical protein
MNGPEMIVLIVLIVAIVRIVQARSGIVRTGRGKEQAYVGRPQDDGEAERLRGEVRQLKDRIAVLERIVTDGDRNRGMALEREIEALRHDKELR